MHLFSPPRPASSPPRPASSPPRPPSSPLRLWSCIGLWSSLLGGACGKGAAPTERPAPPATPADAAGEVIFGDLQALGFAWHPLLRTEQPVGAAVFAPAGIPQPRISRWENSSELVGDDVLKLAELERQLDACAKEAA